MKVNLFDVEFQRLLAANGAYTPKRSRDAQTRVGRTFRSLGLQAPLDGNLAVACVFYRPDLRRVDGDNLLKLVTDAGSKARVWHDDSQITAWACRMELDRANPRTLIAIAPHTSTLTR
jgi:Holliday junction resolvase RusA-like endonuclease